MTLIEAAKQAREALEEAHYKIEHKQDPVKREKAIIALDQAIAEAEQQEPVAWRNAAIRVGEDLCSVGPFGYYDMTAEQWLDWALSVVTVHAPPPQRTWQGLTDEGIDLLLLEHDMMVQWPTQKQIHAFANAIEAKLKEKNA